MPIPYAIHDDDPDLVRVSPPSSTAVLAALKAKVALDAFDGYPRAPVTAADEDEKKPAIQIESADSSDYEKQKQEHKPELEKNGREMKVSDKARREVQAAIDEATKRIKDQSDRFQQAAVPLATRVRDFAERRPVLFTFAVIWTALSVLPIVFFAGFVLSVTGIVLGVAAIGICLSVLGTILFGATILLPVLFVTSCAAIFFVASLVGLFLAHRLYLHLAHATRTDAGRVVSASTVVPAVSAWVRETLVRAESALPLALVPARRVVVVKSGDATPTADAVVVLGRAHPAPPAAHYSSNGPSGADALARAGAYRAHAAEPGTLSLSSDSSSSGAGSNTSASTGTGTGSSAGLGTEFDTTESEGTSWASVSRPQSLASS
ncbi:hypothetical protein Q5752_002846 [Cryptotrichosporon argae]